MINFWKKIKGPIFCLAPMSDVTDYAFRQIIIKYSKIAHPVERTSGPIFGTEFVSADGLAHPEARKKLLINLKYSKKEKPIIAQIFGARPENIKIASTLCKKLNFDGIDINMGCPDRSVEKQGAGAALIKNPKLAKEIIRAAKEGSGGLPISVKTRIGYNKEEIDTWIKELLLQDLDALTVHLRTRKEMSLVSAHWNFMKKIVKMRDKINKRTLIIGNGDVMNLEEAKKKIKENGCDGVMIGRAVLGNPWLFSKLKPTTKDKLRALSEHTRLFDKELGKYKSFAVMKKHYKAYVNGFLGAKELRIELMRAENCKEVKKIINDFLARL